MNELDDLAALRTENAHLRERVQRLRKRLGADNDLGYLFVVTYGRSGSTLVSGLLNTIPGYVIRGENRSALLHLYRYHQTLIAEKKKGPASTFRTPTHPWFGIGDVPLDRSLAGVRRLVLQTLLRPQADTRVVGFKEIRWYDADMEAYVAWLREVFPGARFLINTRAHTDVLKSAWWAEEDPAKAAHNATFLAETERRILAVAADLGDAAYRIHYDDYVADPTTLKGLYDWLDEEWDEASVRATLAVRHSV